MRGERAKLLEKHLADLCASFQQAVIDMLIVTLKRAVRRTGMKHVAVAGGVSANRGLRSALNDLARTEDFALYTPSTRFCTDNAAMIAITGFQKLKQGLQSPLTLTAKPNLSIR